MAISAVDVALWDLKAKLLDLPLATLLGAVHEQVPGLWQRRVHQLQHRAPAAAAGRLGAGRDPAREDEGRQPTRDDDVAAYAPRARRSATRRRCSSTPTAPTPASRRWHCRALRRARRRELVRGAGLLRGPRRPAAAARPRAGGHGRRGRRVRLRARLLPADAGRRRGRRAAGRRHALRRDHRPAAPSPRSARPTSSRSRRTARRSCTRTRAARSGRCATWSTSTTTPASSACSSTAPWSPRTARCGPTPTVPGLGIELKAADAEDFAA